MSNVKFFGVVAALAFVACNGDGKDESGAPTDETKTTDTKTPPEICFQERGVENGQIEFTEDTALTIEDNFAITTSAPAPATALPSGLDDSAMYHGAVDPAATGDVWWQGWTVGGDYDGTLSETPFHPLQAEIKDPKGINAADTSACVKLGLGTDGGTVNIYGEDFPICVVSDDIDSGDVTWPNSHVFLLTDTIEIGTGDDRGGPTTNATLTIEAGTQVFAVADSAVSLVVTRGSTLTANGTAERPILFSALEWDGKKVTGDPTDVLNRGQWGGVVMSGFGVTNSGDDNGEVRTEAAPKGQERYFGGDDNTDSSGSLTYAIIAESGFAFRPDEEVQGLTLEAAGSGTTLDYIQVLGSEDDAVEWFGGAASISHTINNGPDDDGWDQDLGWVGTIQFGIHKHGEENGDRGIESDNNGDNFDAAPQTAPDIANITIIGGLGKGESFAALHREGWRGQVFRSVYTDGDVAFVNGCLDVDDILPSELQYRDVVMNCANGALLECDDTPE